RQEPKAIPNMVDPADFTPRMLAGEPGMCVHPGAPRGERMLEPFALDATEVSIAEYQRCIRAGACRRNVMPDSTDPRAPVNSVSWYDAMAYCEWAGKSLPTWEQWTWALFGGEPHRKFPWGDE